MKASEDGEDVCSYDGGMSRDDNMRGGPVEEWLTSAEAAAYLRVSVRTLEGMRVRGDGPRYFKVGPARRAKVLYRREDLSTWMEKFGFQSTGEY